MSKLPPLNARIKKLITEKTGLSKRNASPFARMISEGREKPIIQQRLDKILDEKIGSAVAPDILEAILLRFPEVDAYWLITGKKKSGALDGPDNLLNQVKTQIDNLLPSLHKLADLIPLNPEEENSNQGGAYQGFGVNKSQSTDKL